MKISIPDNQFVTRHFTNSVSDWFCIFSAQLIPLKGKRRRKRFILTRRVKYLLNVTEEFKENEIRKGKEWIQSHLRETLDKGFIEFGTGKKFEIDKDRLDEIEFVTNEKLSLKKIDKWLKRIKEHGRSSISK